jgi:predicted DNA-binding transcriptional regulator YafY
LFARACAAQRIVECGYTDQRGSASVRRVEPVRLVLSDHRWYVAAYDLDRQDWRTFRLDRIGAAELSEHRFHQRSGPDPIELVHRSAPAEAFAHQARVTVACTANEARGVIPESIATVAAHDETCTLLIGTDDLNWLTHYLLALPWPFEVTEPPELRARIRKQTKAIAARHARVCPT